MLYYLIFRYLAYIRFHVVHISARDFITFELTTKITTLFPNILRLLSCSLYVRYFRCSMIYLSEGIELIFVPVLSILQLLLALTPDFCLDSMAEWPVLRLV